MEDVCLYDLVRDYDRVGVDNDDQYTYSKLTKPHLPNHKLFDPEKETQREDYFYSMLRLFVPFRREADLLGPDETEAFQRHLQPGSGLHLHHDKLQQILAARNQVMKINEARQKDQPPPVNVKDDAGGDDGPQIQGEAQSAMNDVRNLQDGTANQINLAERVSMMNEDQARVYRLVKEHLLHQEARDQCMSVHRFETPAHVSHWCQRNGQVIPHRGYKINGCRDLAWEDGWPYLRCDSAHRSGRFQCWWCDNTSPTPAAD